MPRRELAARAGGRHVATERRGRLRLTRPFSAIREVLVARAEARRNPFTHTDPAVAGAILERLDSTAHEPWVDAFMTEARRHERRGDWLAAYGYARVARYPAPTSAPKREAYARSRALYLRSVADVRPATAVVSIPFAGGSIRGYLRIAAGARSPLVVCWGGIDSFKEERRTEPYLEAGWSTLAIDMPGTGESPIAGAVDAERLWDPIFDWVATRDELDAARIVVIGNSTGGYWAAKLAHLRRERIAAAVDHGGPAHHAFTRAWTGRAENGEYPFEYSESLAHAFGGATSADWLEIAPRLSLLKQGVLDRPCSPLLLVNGRADSVFPIEDLHLVLSRGGPKWSRIFPGGHMGDGDTAGAIVAWLRERLTPGR